MQHSNFIHLHVHSQYSLLDGAIRFEEALELAKQYRMDALALTDHGNMFGAIEFYQTAIKHGEPDLRKSPSKEGREPII